LPNAAPLRGYANASVAVSSDSVAVLSDSRHLKSAVCYPVTVGAWHTLREASYGQYLSVDPEDNLPNAAPLRGYANASIAVSNDSIAVLSETIPTSNTSIAVSNSNVLVSSDVIAVSSDIISVLSENDAVLSENDAVSSQNDAG
jgi:hypothetical protein